VSTFGVLGLVLLSASGSARAQPPIVSTLDGQITIGGGLTGTTIVNTATTVPIPTMILTFSGAPHDTVEGDLVPFAVKVPASIKGVGIFNSFYRDACDDHQSISSVRVLSGMFDRVSGHVDDLQLTLTVRHVLTPGATTSPFGWLGGCAGTSFPDDVVTVSLSTMSGGSPLDSSGLITLVGTAPASAGAFPGTPVTVTVMGSLSPLPDRTPPAPGCVVLPDGPDGQPNHVSNMMVALGLHPIFVPRPGPLRDPYVYRQSPEPDTCVAPGSNVYLYLQSGPVN
jgi:hypothetical protein